MVRFFLLFCICFYFSLLLLISSDLKADCADRSGNFFFFHLFLFFITVILSLDEEDCKKVVFPSDYEKDLAPKHTVNGKRVDEALPVFLSLDILSFDKIDTVEMMIG